MSKKSVKENEIVLPGQYLGVVEEFLPDKNSTFVKEGEIFAAKTGKILIDNKKHQIQVESQKEDERKTVKVGDTVIGEVVFLRKFSIGITFYSINSKVHFNSSTFGNVHVSQISNKYIEKIQDAFQITDVLRARVTSQNLSEFDLTTAGNNLGVIHADCAICGTELEKIGFDKLRCPRCGHLEKRKLASDYADVKEHLRF